MPAPTQLTGPLWDAGMMLGNAISGVSVGLTALLEEFAVGKPCLHESQTHALRLTVCTSMKQLSAVLGLASAEKGWAATAHPFWQHCRADQGLGFKV